MSHFPLLTLFLGLFCWNQASAQMGFGHSTPCNDGWRFALTDDSLAITPSYDDSSWRDVQLPHDWSIEGTPDRKWASCTGYLPGGYGTYRRTFDFRPEQGRQYYIYFEGVYCRSQVWLNGHLLGYRPNGYASFGYDMTPWLQSGTNTLCVRVNHTHYADSRWYTGSGIYRDVWMVEAPTTHLAQWATHYVCTELTDQSATVHVSTEIENNHAGTRLEYEVDGRRVDSIFTIDHPRRWDIDSPNLYALKVRLIDGGVPTDSTTIQMGLRSLRFDADSGFYLNERNIKVKGVCIHHDAGVLGAAVPPEVWHRRLLALKQLGVNGIRCSHNPQAPVLYDLCDRLGLLVMDEASDEWEYPKRKWVEGWNVGKPSFDGTYDFFEEWIDRDVADMVRRDRNHPCVFLWSIGNEVDYPNDPYSHPILDGKNAVISQPMFGGYDPKRPNAERIGIIAQRLSKIVRSLDSSRPVTGALAGVVMSNQTAYPGAVDVVGYNYTESRYIEDHQNYPGRIIYGSETGRGEKPWAAVRDNQHIFGHFVWTGLDYLGESGRWPSRGLGTGLLDFTGEPKFSGLQQAALWAGEPAPQWPGRNGQRGHRRNQEQADQAAPHAFVVDPDTICSNLPGSTLQLRITLTDAQQQRLFRSDLAVTCRVEGAGHLLGLETGNNQDMSLPSANVRNLHFGRLLAYVRRDAPGPIRLILETEGVMYSEIVAE